MNKFPRPKPSPESARLGAQLADLAWRKPPQEQKVLDLLLAGADPDGRDWMARPALSLAIGAQNIGLARLLLLHGADPDAADSFKNTPLIWAVDASVPELIPDLLKSGANVDARDRDGYTALMKAATCGKGKIALLLIDAGAKLDLQSDHGSTALTLACLNTSDMVDNGQADIVRLLVDRGAAPSIKNKDGKSGPDYIRTRGLQALLAYIEEAPARVEAARKKLVVPKPAKPLKPLPSHKKPPGL